MGWTYIKAVFRHWATAMTGTAGLVVSIIAAAKNSNFLFIALTAGCGLVLLLIAGYKAWKEQYDENEVGRTLGSLSMEAIVSNVEILTGQQQMNVQIEVKLRNLQPRLAYFTVETIQVELGGKVTIEPFVNRGSFIHPSSTATFLNGVIKGLPLQPVTGTMELDISYKYVGSKRVLRSRRKLQLTVSVHPDAGAIKVVTKYLTLEASEA